MYRIVVAAAFIATSFARSSEAQTLRGSVRDSASAQPISGAVLALRDSSGATLTRVISDEGGKYSIPLAPTGLILRIVRIGFVPREIPIAEMTRSNEPLSINLVSMRTMLTAIRVEGTSNCPHRADNAAALGLWEQAKAGLLSQLVAQETNPASIYRLAFQRTMTGNSNRIARFSVDADSSGFGSRSWSAGRSATEFAKFGFSSDGVGAQKLFGPDAEILLDDAFARAYCFGLVSPTRARPQRVGLSFAPAQKPRGRVDSDGILWVDTAARALTDIEYRYVGLSPYTDEFRPGGRVSFRDMPNGTVLVDQWLVRGVTVTNGDAQSSAAPVLRSELAATEVGGELARATWPDGKLWKAPLGSLRLRAVSSAGHAVAGAIAVLANTRYRGVADDAGSLVIDDLLPGPYSLEFIDKQISPLGIAIPGNFRFDAVRDSTFRATVRVPTAAEYVAQRCASAQQLSAGDSALIFGRVVTNDGEPVDRATVTFAAKANTGQWLPLAKRSHTDGNGLFQLCGQNPGGPVQIHVRRLGMADVDTIAAPGTTPAIVRISAVRSP
jgi:hypothetical protein